MTCLRRIRPLLPISSGVWAVIILGCSAVATPSPSPPAELPTAVTIPTATLNRPAPATPTPTRIDTASAQITAGERVFIQLTDPLDEPEYYCVDVPGAGRGVRLESALQAHTCKPISTAADELFTMDRPNEGQIYMEAYDLCVEAEGASKGSSLRLQPCSDSPLQLFALDNGLIRLGGGAQESVRMAGDFDHLLELCLAVDPDSGIPTGGPSHLRRALTLEVCESVEPTLSRWSVGLFDY